MLPVPDSIVYYPKPEVLTGLRHDHHAVIEASAGTGKTFLIEHAVLDLLLTAGVRLDQILVVTFTEKATAELKARLRASLTRLLTADEAVSAPDGPHWPLDDAARHLLEQALYRFGAAPIFTIHGFCQRVLTENAFNHRRLFAQSQVEAETAFDRAFTAALRHEFARDALYQRWLRAWLDQSSLDGLRGLIARCLGAKAPLYPVFAVDAFAETLRCLQTMLGEPSKLHDVLAEVEKAALHGGTKKAVLSRIKAFSHFLRDYAEVEKLPHLLGAIDRGALTYLYNHLTKSVLTPESGAAIRQFSGALGAFRELCVPFPAAVVQLFLPVVEARLRQDKQRQGGYDFDDMLSLVWEGLQPGPHGEMLLQTLRQRYRYALIDEFQDTDLIQWQIFRRLFLDSERDNILYVIGDPKQAIYAFRGADVHTYLKAREEIHQIEGDRLSLRWNFRSTSAMVEALNGVFAPDVKAPFFTGAIQYDTPVQCGNPTWRGLNPDDSESQPIHVLQLLPEGGTVNAASTRSAFGRRMAQIIAGLLSSPGDLRIGSDGDRRPVTASDMLILTRTGVEGEEIAQYLWAAGVPYAFYKQEGLFQTPAARAIYDLLLAVESPQERSKRFKAWLTPFFGVSLGALSGCEELPSTHPLAQRLLTWKSLADRQAFGDLFADILSRSGWVQRHLLLQQDPRELTNVQHIFELLLEEVSRAHHTLPELLVTLKAMITGVRRPGGENGNIQRLPGDHDAVQIMTMHKSKGLEAAVVFVTGGFVRGRGDQVVVRHEAGTRVVQVEPDDAARSAARHEESEEEQRLLYVALTRAKARLYLPYIEPVDYPDRFQGCHRRLNTRLARVLTDASYAAVQAHCIIHPFTIDAVHSPLPTLPARVSLSQWQPPPQVFERLDRREPFQSYRQRHAPFVVSSYSRMKHADGGFRPLSMPQDISRDGLQTLVVEWDDTTLPGGTLSGRFIHDVLENVPLDSFQLTTTTTTFDGWRRQPLIVKLFEQMMRRYARGEQYLESSQRLVYNGLTTPVAVGEGKCIPALAACAPFLREMEFLYPIPECCHPRLDALTSESLRIDKGYIKGFVDFLCRYDGLHYFGDWKTDSLPAYRPDVMAAHIEQNYTWQIKLYALALVKLLEIHSEADYDAQFGGMLYCFLRGMANPVDHPASGVLYARPGWNEILAYEAELMQRQTYL